MISADGLRRFMLHPYWRADGIDAEAKRSLWNVVALPSQHPYGWSQTHVRANPQSAWMPLAPFDERDAEGVIRFQPSKYRTAKYSSRQLMGWDAALKRAAEDPAPQKWVVLCEGPLDAARVGPGGVALIGSSLSPDNAARVASNFHIVFTAFDNDMAGKSATEKIGRMLMGTSSRSSVTQLVVPLQVTDGKDIGGMTQAAADALLKRAVIRAMKSV